VKYVSIDIETTGLDHTFCQMIEFGAVVDDLEKRLPLDKLPRFHCYILRDRYVGEPFALAMNARILERIAKKEAGYNYYRPEDGKAAFATFLWDNRCCDKHDLEVNVAGKNFDRFDYRFLENDGWHQFSYKLHRRVIDPAQMYFVPRLDKHLPGLKDCLSRAGIEKEVEHTAIADALDVVKLIRQKYKE